MKKITLLLAVVMAGMFMLNSCGKYEEGPSFSILGKTSRITGVWKIDKMIVNNVEQTITEEFGAVRFELMKDGKGKVIYSFGGLSINVNLEWKFNSDKTHVSMRMQDITDTTVWGEWVESEILRLTNKELWVKESDTDGGVTTETITHFSKV